MVSRTHRWRGGGLREKWTRNVGVGGAKRVIDRRIGPILFDSSPPHLPVPFGLYRPGKSAFLHLPLSDTQKPLSEAVLRAVAEAEGTEPHELDKQLYDVIDPEALNSLFRDNKGKVEFPYLDYVVSVDPQGVVKLAPMAEQA